MAGEPSAAYQFLGRTVVLLRQGLEGFTLALQARTRSAAVRRMYPSGDTRRTDA
ncbi:hypothetical protein RKD19_000054 [Streptomyces canus]|uniref:Uncharacterized protein n=1 Tax=Streptomyces griseoaurantiacus M045 TaxID=996637 RepID=F3NE45_9ACTN|nr:hypothetical protein [Streptomyces griseoaurantiacus]EGG48315.1 hypothetical protein SGM_1409 [Streptomyces griseoaurantiacus M045]